MALAVSMIDLSAIDAEDLLVRLDLQNARLTSSGQEIKFSCFGSEHSHGDETPSAFINVETTAWFCHMCKRRGNAISLVMEVQDLPRATAERSLRDWYGIEFDEPIGGSMVVETERRLRVLQQSAIITPPPATWLSGVRLDWDDAYTSPQPFESYMIERGFMPSTLAEWDIGYDYLSDRLTIPVFDVDGNLVGIKGRDWTGTRPPKYLILGDRQIPRYGFMPYEASEVVFGLHRNRGCRTGVLCEGELNAVALSQIGVPRPIAMGMSYFSERHAQIVVRELDELIVFLDHGEAGHSGAWGRTDPQSGKFFPGVVQAIEPHMPVRVASPLPEDPADLMQQGRGLVALQLIDEAVSSLVASIATVLR